MKFLPVDTSEFYRSGKRAVSFMMLNILEDREAFIAVCNNIYAPQNEAMLIGSALHKYVAGDTSFNINSINDIETNRYINVHDLFKIKYLDKLLKEKDLYKDVISASVSEQEIICRVYFQDRIFYIKGFLDYINIDKKVIVEVKTTASAFSYISTMNTVKKYRYDVQLLIYNYLATAKYIGNQDYSSYVLPFTNYFVFFNKNSVECNDYKISSFSLTSRRATLHALLEEFIYLVDIYRFTDLFFIN